MKNLNCINLAKEIRAKIDITALNKTAVFTCDIEPDYGFRTGTEELLEEERYIKTLTDWCEMQSIPITCFVVTKLLQKNLPAINFLHEKNIEIHAHSHSHNTKTYIRYASEEIARSQEEFTKYTGTASLGYRAPQGIMLPENTKTLAAQGFEFSSSIFPAKRWGKFNQRDLPQTPWIWNSGVIEYPFAVSVKRRMLTVSYLKLLGKFFWEKEINHLPHLIIIDSHLHDFFIPNSISDLPLHIQIAYSRNKKNGLSLLKWTCDKLLAQGYKFSTMTALHRTLYSAQ